MENIGGQIKDVNYRYKMPGLIIKLEGRKSGGSSRTNLVNLQELSRSLKVPPIYILKFMGYELGTSAKEWKGNYIINGVYEPEEIKDLLKLFIERHVLCSNCSLPELMISPKRGRLLSRCSACGDIGILKQEDKLVKFILRDLEKKI